MDKFTEFILEHEGDEVESLVLQRGRWPDIDVVKAADTIAGRRKMRMKAPSWYDCTEVVYPSRLCVEQCSSEAASEIKAEIIASLWCEGELFSRSKIADLTGGLGVDSWMFSKMAERVLYVERDSKLAEAAKHNFSALGCKNIEVMNAEVSPEGFSNDGWAALKKFAPDIIYLDPARRGEGGEKVFKLEDCRPNILELRDKLLEIAGHVMVKLSPMADIDEVVRQLGPSCLRVDVISVDGECKEVLVTMERGYIGECELVADCGKIDSFSFYRSEEAAAVPRYLSDGSIPNLVGKILLEPDKAAMKAGPFKLLSATYDLTKLDVSTHYYIYGGSDVSEVCDGETKEGGGIWDDEVDRSEKIGGLFRRFRILRVEPLNKKSIRTIGHDYPNAEVTARNIPLSTDELRKRLGVSPSDTIHIFGLRSGGENLLYITEKLQ